jgi:purine-binding chemotaxis protein CheW
VSSKDLRTAQRDALAALQQMRGASSGDVLSQLAQSGIAHPEALGLVSENVPVAVGVQHLVFSLNGRDLAVKAELIQGVERLSDLTVVPNVLPWVKGVMNLRGSIVSVVDLRMFLDLEQLSNTSRTRVLSLQYNEMVICFIVDSVSEMLPVPENAISNGTMRQATIPYWVQSYAAGIALLANRALVLLDVPRLLFSEKMQHYESLG